MRAVSVDNTIYERDAAGWWSDDCHLVLLKGIVPARIELLREAWTDALGRELEGAELLDVGCGGGLSAEELARQGCRVTGIDPSPGSIATAREHAAESDLEIDYAVGAGEELPFADASFDVVSCCDVLEHVDDVAAVLAEAARVLRPGGLFFYDTINRTWLSRLIAIRLLQNWSWLAIAPPDLHSWDRFIRPAELNEALAQAGLVPEAQHGLGADMDPVTSWRRIAAIRRLKRSEISYADLGEHLVFRRVRSLAINYMGWATRRSRPASG